MTTELIEHPQDITTAGPTDGGSHVPPSFTTDHERPGGSRHPWSRRFAAGLLTLGIAVGSGTAGALAVTSLESTGTSAATSTSATTTSATTTGTTSTSSVASVVAKVTPSVVAVIVQGRGSEAEGSGIVIRSDGLILTNNHVVASA